MNPISGTYRTPDGKAQIEYELTYKDEATPVFSASGEYNGGAGQCIDSIAKAYPNDKTVQSIHEVWKRYHLNNMRPGCEHQMEIIALLKIKGLPHDYDTLKTKAAFIECPAERCTAGEFVVVDSGRKVWAGYRYGEAWLYEPIPADIIETIRSWKQAPQAAGSLGDHQAAEFLKKNHISLRITLSDSKQARWSPSGHHYRITLSRPIKTGRTHETRLTFDFWGSAHDAEHNQDPTPYDILSCIGSDISTPDTFEEFIDHFGGNADSIGDLQNFTRCKRHADRLKAFFLPTEIEELQEIQ